MRITLLLPTFVLAACGASAQEVSLVGTDLTATFGDDDSARLSINFTAPDVQPDACPIIPLSGVTFAGVAVRPEDVDAGGATDGEPGCSPLAVRATIDARDPAEDGELLIDSGGATVRWVAENLFAARRFVRAGDASDQVPRGSIVRVNHEPATDLLDEPTAAVLSDDADLALTFRLDVDGIIIDIPSGASPGAQTLNLTVPVEVPSLACEGFASCLLKSSHVEHIPIVIAP